MCAQAKTEKRKRTEQKESWAANQGAGAHAAKQGAGAHAGKPAKKAKAKTAAQTAAAEKQAPVAAAKEMAAAASAAGMHWAGVNCRVNDSAVASRGVGGGRRGAGRARGRGRGRGAQRDTIPVSRGRGGRGHQRGRGIRGRGTKRKTPAGELSRQSARVREAAREQELAEEPVELHVPPEAAAWRTIDGLFREMPSGVYPHGAAAREHRQTAAVAEVEEGGSADIERLSTDVAHNGQWVPWWHTAAQPGGSSRQEVRSLPLARPLHCAALPPPPPRVMYAQCHVFYFIYIYFIIIIIHTHTYTYAYPRIRIMYTVCVCLAESDFDLFGPNQQARVQFNAACVKLARLLIRFIKEYNITVIYEFGGMSSHIRLVPQPDRSGIYISLCTHVTQHSLSSCPLSPAPAPCALPRPSLIRLLVRVCTQLARDCW